MPRFANSPVALFLAGLSVFVVALAAAIVWLPEWRLEPLPDAEVFEKEAKRTARELGLVQVEPFQIELTDRGVSADNPQAERERMERFLGPGAAKWLEEHDRTFYVVAKSQADTADGRPVTIELKYTLDAEIVEVQLVTNEIGMGMISSEGPLADSMILVRTLLRPGERVGEPETISILVTEFPVYPIFDQSGRFVESVQMERTPNFPAIKAIRIPATAKQIENATSGSIFQIIRAVWVLATRVAFGIGVVALLVALAAQRSLGLKNGLLLATIQVLFVMPAVVSGQQHLLETLFLDLIFLMTSFVVFIGWSAAESWYRILSSETTTGLDHLRERILGRSDGRSLIAGWGVGAGIAGLLLLGFLLANAVGWIRTTASAVDVSALFEPRNPWFSAVMIAIAVLLAYGVGAKFFPAGKRLPFTLLTATLLLVPVVGIEPLPVTLWFALIIAAALEWTLRTFQLLGLLTASVIFFALPVAAFSLLHPTWQPVDLLVSAALVVTPMTLGFVGLARKEDGPRERVAAPVFLRRIEHEKRLRYEMDLLHRMQLGLLPASPPQIPGWQIAVRSVLPTEVGGDFYEFIEDEDGCLWIGMGDVSGHGYQCSIAHAMTKAALLSLVSGSRRPAEVMNRLDQVLRHSGTARTFVALALMRLDVKTGEIVYSNAASPFPIVVRSEGVNEIELSTLPLGHGPVQRYENHVFRLDPAQAIVFWSDGLYEARNPLDDEYGYDRPGDVAKQHLEASATELMEAIFSDWERFRSGADVEDDTTVLVIKRTE